MIERTLRWVAIAIAAAAFVDPLVTVSGRARPRVAVLPASAAERAASADVRARIGRDLQRDFEVVDGADAEAAAAVVVGTSFPYTALADGAKVSTVTLSPVQRRTRIDAVDAPTDVPPATAVRLLVRVHANGARGAKSAVVVRAKEAEVGRAEHTWTGDDESWLATIDAVPVGEPPYVFSIDADGDQARVAVAASPPLRVLVFEARPSWASAFVRRALEADPRFEVSGLSDVAPRAAVATGPAPELPKDPTRFDAVVVGGLEHISAASTATLHRFTRERGGVVILVPDAKVPDSVSRELLPGLTLRETLLERPAALLNTESVTTPPIEASELLEAETIPSSTLVFARAAASQRPVVWRSADGEGAIIVSGAMDAWRYRGGKESTFDRFWRSIVAGAALSAQPPVSVTASPRRARLGERIRVTARVRKLEADQLGERLAIAAAAGTTPVRLWPDAQPGQFSGWFVLDSPAQQTIVASLREADMNGRAHVTVDEHAREARSVPPLSLLAQTHGGVNVPPEQLADLERHLRATIPIDRRPTRVRPMRSPWWIAPFALCLTGEWWLRRTRGAR